MRYTVYLAQTDFGGAGCGRSTYFSESTINYRFALPYDSRCTLAIFPEYTFLFYVNIKSLIYFINHLKSNG